MLHKYLVDKIKAFSQAESSVLGNRILGMKTNLCLSFPIFHCQTPAPPVKAFTCQSVLWGFIKEINTVFFALYVCLYVSLLMFPSLCKQQIRLKVRLCVCLHRGLYSARNFTKATATQPKHQQEKQKAALLSPGFPFALHFLNYWKYLWKSGW